MTIRSFTERRKADLTLFGLSIIWGSSFVAQRVAGQMGSVYFFNGARYLIAALVVFPFALQAAKSSKRKSLLPPRGRYKWMIIEGFFLFIASALQQAGVVYTTAGNAGFITSLYILLIPIALFLFWHEKPHWIFIAAVIIAGVGAFLLSTGGKFEAHAGDLLELIGALFWTIHLIILSKVATRFEAISFSVGQLFVCGVLNLGTGFFVEPLPPFNGSLIFGIVYTGCFALGLSYTLQIWALHHTPPAEASLIMSLESVFSVIAGWLMLNEKLIASQILGCFLIFSAVLLCQFKEFVSAAKRPQVTGGTVEEGVAA